MNSLENVFARRAEKTSEAICETVRDSWPARRCNLHDDWKISTISWRASTQ